MLIRMISHILRRILVAKKTYIVNIRGLKIIIIRGCFRPDISYSTYLSILGAVDILKTCPDVEKICEIGGGSGIIGLIISKMFKKYVVLTDVSENAMVNMRVNAQKLNIDNRVDIVRTYSAYAIRDSVFDMAITNPPYLPCDRRYLEICADHDMRILRDIIRDSYRIVRRGGQILYTTSSIAPVVVGRVTRCVKTPIDTVYLVLRERS